MRAFSGLSFAQGTPGAAPSNAGDGAPGDKTSEERSTSFRAVQGGNEMQSGEKLLVEAYAVFWLLLFVMLFLFWLHQKQLDRRIDGLSHAIAKARRDAAGPDAGEGSAGSVERAAEGER